MELKNAPELLSFFSTYLSDTDSEADEQTTRAFVAQAPAERVQRILSQAKLLLESPELPLDEIGTEANRWFAEQSEARLWLSLIVSALESGSSQNSPSRIVKDSNGAVLNEGDSVTVIKDLKVKGGSSDLKRGTMIKKIHLVDDSEVVECRVDGSTLVLKTCFLKKA